MVIKMLSLEIITISKEVIIGSLSLNSQELSMAIYLLVIGEYNWKNLTSY